MKDDTISRAAALDFVSAMNFCGEISDEAYQKLTVHFENLPSATDTNVGGNLIDRQAAIDAVNAHYDDEYFNFYTVMDILKQLPSAQPERTCVNCGRTANNGGWYADGRTRCPIEEHYALPKDGYCHLWEKRNVTDDDYPERRTDEE